MNRSNTADLLSEPRVGSPSLDGRLCLGLLLGLAACGGGGDDLAPPPAPPPVLSASNYQPVSQAVVFAAQFALTLPELATAAFPGNGVSAATLARHTRRALRARPAAQSSMELNCQLAGKLLIGFNDVNGNDEIDVGDSLSLQAQGCTDADGVLNGSFSLTLQELTGGFDSGVYSARFALTLSDWARTEGADSFRSSGSVVMRLSEDAQGGDATIEAPSWTLSGREDGVDFNHALSALLSSTHFRALPSGEERSSTFAAVLASSILAGQSLTITTPQTLLFLGDDEYPRSGQLLVRVGGGGTLRMTAISNAQVRIEVDAADDGSFEISELKNWSDFE